MRRHETIIEDGTLYIETEGDDRLEVGTLETIFELVGGRTFEVKYDTRHAAYFDWIETDADGVMTIDVREALDRMSYPPPFLEELAARDMVAIDGGPPERTAYFADIMTDIWEQKGNLEDDDNPFL
jgi:hypothetical protein